MKHINANKQKEGIKMGFSEEGTFRKATLEEFKEALGHAQNDYAVWIRNCDSIYPMTGLNVGMVDDSIPSVASIETYGKNAKVYTVGTFLCCIDMALNDKPDIKQEAVIAEEAQDYDESLDLQLDSPRFIQGWGIDKIFHAFFLITGSPLE